MMARFCRNSVACALWTAMAMFGAPALGQDRPADQPKPPREQSLDAARQEILQSDRWRRMQRNLNEWLSVQTIYTAEQVDAMRADIRKRCESMSPRDLADFLEDMEERLDVLLSPEAEDARVWLKQFLAVAANPEAQLGRPLPDIANMSASQIRREIQWLQQHRAARQQAHAAGARSRQLQAERRPQRPTRPDRAAWPANNVTRPSRYAPQPELRPQPLTVTRYAVSPWGTPWVFDPLGNPW